MSVFDIVDTNPVVMTKTKAGVKTSNRRSKKKKSGELFNPQYDKENPQSNPPFLFQRPDCLTFKEGLKSLPPAHFGVFDIETDGFGGDFIVGGLYEPFGGYKLFYKLSELTAYMRNSLYVNKVNIWYAHNGMSFDYQYLLHDEDCRNEFLKNGFTISPLASHSQAVGLRVVEKVVEEGKKPLTIQLRDFFRIFPRSLKDITEILEVEHQKRGDIDFAGGEVFDIHNPNHMTYLEYDVMGLYEAVEKFRTLWFEAFHDDLGWTMPSMALSAWRRTNEQIFWRHSKDFRDFFRESYRGGMVSPHYIRIGEDPETGEEYIPMALINEKILKKGEEPIIHSFDFNSMYPAMMLRGVPVGNPYITKELVYGLPGFYDVQIESPEDGFPFVAIKTKTGLLYPRGKFDAILPSVELFYALEQGYRLLKVNKGYVFPEIQEIFKDFITICMQIRKDYKGTALEQVAKLAQNALYGKFGSSEQAIRLVLSEEDLTDDGYEVYADPITGDWSDVLYTKEDILDVPYLHPEWASWITASARVTLAKAINAVGYTRFVYSDTDSLKIVANGLPMEYFSEVMDIDDTRYGALKYEYSLKFWACSGPKTYEGITVEPYKGKNWIVAAKGVPTKKVEPNMILQASKSKMVEVAFTSGRSAITMIKKGLNYKWVETHRALTRPSNVLNWDVDEERLEFLPKTIGGGSYGGGYCIDNQDDVSILQ